jgi:membrane protein required for colicin V production
MVIDIIFAVSAAWGFYVGFSRGIVKTIFTVLSVVFGLIMALRFGPQVTGVLESAFSKNPLMFIAGFLVTFVGTMMLIRLFARFIEGALESANINFINQTIGGLFTAVLFTLIYSTLLWFGDKSKLISDEGKRDSLTYERLEQFPGIVLQWGAKAKPIFADFWEHSIQFMDELERMGAQREESEPYIYDIPED